MPSVTGASATKSVSATAQQDETLDELVEGASEEFSIVFAQLKAWASAHGHVWSRSKKSFRLETAEGEYLLHIYPQWGTIEVSLNSMIQAGMDGEVERLREQFGRIIGKTPDKNPNIPCNRTLPAWPTFLDALDEYVVGRLRAAAIQSPTVNTVD